MLKALRRYLGNHRQALAETLARFAKSPASGALAVSLIAVALALPATSLAVLSGVDTMLAGFSAPAEISVYAKPRASDARVRQLAEEIEGIEGVARTTVVSAAQSLRRFGEQRDVADLLALFEDNPLPAVIEVETGADHQDEAALNLLGARLALLPGADRVENNAAWLGRLAAIVALAQAVVHLLAALFAAVVLLVVAAIIRSEIETRKDEIDILGLLGAGDAFIRRPFFYAGLCYGLAGGVLAGAVTAGASAVIGEYLQALLDLYRANLQWRPPSWPRVLLYTTSVGGALCVAGAWLSVRMR